MYVELLGRFHFLLFVVSNETGILLYSVVLMDGKVTFNEKIRNKLLCFGGVDTNVSIIMLFVKEQNMYVHVQRERGQTIQ